MSERESIFERDIPYCSNGSFDFEKIKQLNISGFWNELFNREKYVQNDSADSAVSHDSSLYEACEKWVYGKEDSGKIWEEYLYGGDPALKQVWGASYNPDYPGLTVRLARALFHIPMLKSLYYHYSRIYSKNPNTYSNKTYFSQLLIETVRRLLPDLWKDDLKLFAATDPKSFFCVFESLFIDYDRVKSGAKKVRQNDYVDKQSALPHFAALNKKIILMESIADKATRELQKILNGISAAEKTKIFVDTFSPLWEKHRNARGIEVEENACRFNDAIADILENLTAGEIREAEKQKNQESGAVGRVLKKTLSDQNSDSIKKSAAMERFNTLRIKHETLDQIDEDGRSAYEWMIGTNPDDFYTPEDFSQQIWETLSDAEKVLLIATSLAQCESYTGFYGVFSELFPDINANFIGINLKYKILRPITGKDFPEIKDAKTSKAACLRDLNALSAENKTDLLHNTNLLANCLSRNWFDLDDPANQRLYKAAEILCRKLNEHNAGKARKQNLQISNGGDDLL